MSHPLLERSYGVCYSDLGPLGTASPAALCRWMQESAILHAHELGVAMEAFAPRGWAWILARLHVRFARYPAWREAVTVATWPSELFGLYAMRQFRLTGEDGAELAVASSSWVVIDAASRRPLRRVPDELRGLHSHEPERVLPRNPPRLPEGERCDLEERFRVRRSDLDANGHVNNVVTIAQATQAVPAETWEKRRLAELVIEFKAELHHGDEVAARSQRLEEPADAFLHTLIRERDGKEAARARTRWADPGA